MDRYKEILDRVAQVKVQRGSMYKREPKDVVPLEILESVALLKAYRGYEGNNVEKKIDEYTDLINYCVFIIERLEIEKGRNPTPKSVPSPLDAPSCFGKYDGTFATCQHCWHGLKCRDRFKSTTKLPIAIVDVDEILWGFNDALRDCAHSHGYEFPTREQCTHWGSVYEFIPKPEALKLFDEVHSNQLDYAPFPDAKKFLDFMMDHFYVIIASHRNPDHKGVLAEWLNRNHLYCDELNVSFDKTALFKRSGAKVVVDDRDETLRIGMKNNLCSLGLRRPWNERNDDIVLFDSLEEITEFIKKEVLDA